jgi:hypothetical protein
VSDEKERLLLMLVEGFSADPDWAGDVIRCPSGAQRRRSCYAGRNPDDREHAVQDGI